MSEEKRRRPSSYTKKLGQRICDLLAEGKTLNSICKNDKFPSERTVRRWASDDKHPFAPNYARAREVGYLRMADEILEISDDGSNDTRLDDEGNEIVNHDVIQRSRLRVETRKWLLSKALPKIYGEKIQIDARHEHVNGLSDAELERIASGRSEGAAEAAGDPSKLN